MSYEIERKFLVRDSSWRAQADHGERLRQGYLAGGEQGSVRVRIGGGQARLNIKGRTLGAVRREFDYPIPLDDAAVLLDELCERPLIEKTRYRVAHAGHVWEVDEFAGDNHGLVVAEIELEAADAPFERPAWVGDEVTDDARYYNVALARHPYRAWQDAG
jgi:adenylate cyclase